MAGKTFIIPVALAVLSLGIFATGSSAQPTVITACGEITAPGSYRLGNNLAVPGQTCLSVTASDVTIDLNGFEISRVAVAIVGASGVRGLTVRNGTIASPAVGIAASDGLVVDRVTFSGNQRGVNARNQAIVRDSLFFSDDIDNGTAISLVSGLVTGNVIYGSGLDGIVIGSGTVSGNVLRGAADVGGSARGLSMGGGTVVNNTVQNYPTGLVIVCPSNVLGNTATGNGINLFLSGDPSTCNVEHNLAP